MSDVLEYFEDSLIQHGKENDRVYLMKLNPNKTDQIINHIENLAAENNYTKIFTKVPVSKKEKFTEKGYIQEAFIPKFYRGKEDCCFLVKYPDKNSKRNVLCDRKKIKSVISTSLSKQTKDNNISLPEEFVFEELNFDHTQEIASVYKKVFETYPFPIFDPAYISKTMEDNIIYFGIKKNGKIVALSSAEIDYDGLNAEMTDFATLKEYRGNNLSLFLLQKMEERIKDLGIKTAYTIARSVSCGMNVTFARNNYHFGGTLINNTNISGNLESMNIWYKNL